MAAVGGGVELQLVSRRAGGALLGPEDAPLADVRLPSLSAVYVAPTIAVLATLGGLGTWVVLSGAPGKGDPAYWPMIVGLVLVALVAGQLAAGLLAPAPIVLTAPGDEGRVLLRMPRTTSWNPLQTPRAVDLPDGTRLGTMHWSPFGWRVRDPDGELLLRAGDRDLFWSNLRLRLWTDPRRDAPLELQDRVGREVGRVEWHGGGAAATIYAAPVLVEVTVALAIHAQQTFDLRA